MFLGRRSTNLLVRSSITTSSSSRLPPLIQAIGSIKHTTRLVNTMASDGKNPGLLLVRAKAKNPDLTDEALNKWYSTVHIQDVVNSGAADLAIRYKNLDPKAEYPYLCLYRVPDLGFVQDAEKMAKIPKTSDLLPGSHDYREELTLERRVYGLLQKFEGQDEQKGTCCGQ